MCGLSGMIDPNGRYGPDAARVMALAIAHRGPDDHADWRDPVLPVSLSFRRLAIIDRSAAANQPMHDGPLTIVFNGEIYNYKELRAELQAQHGQVFTTGSDTEVFLKGILIWGVEGMLKKVNGMYALALLDRRENSLTVARDRFGEKPLYYINIDKSLIFSSEIKSLRSISKAKISDVGAALYKRYGFIPAPFSAHENVVSLSPGEWATFDARSAELKSKGKIPFYEVGDAVREGTPAERFETALTRSIDMRLRADVPVGVFLSGGIDSSLLLLLAQKNLGRSLPSFTIRMAGTDPAYDESAQAARLARFCGSENHVLTLDEQALLDAIPGQIAAMDQPLADAAIIPTALLSAMARDQVTVVLGGEGGDELQAGYSRHTQEGLFRSLRVMMRHDHGFSGMVFNGLWAGLGLGAKFGLPQLRRQMDKLERVARVDARGAYDALMTLWPTQTPISAPDLSFRDADAQFYLPHDLLMKLDGATMGASLEGRCPYLDPGMWATMAEMPRETWTGKKLARNLLSRLVPTDLMPGAKRGLTLPLAPWLRGALKDWGHENLQAFKDSRYGAGMEHDIEAQWQALQSGRSEHAQPIWALCVFSAWCRAHNFSI